MGGTIRWMSPEILALDHSGIKNSRPTKESDCYALGMVIYEVLSGRVPFSKFKPYVVTRKVMDGERPERPEGVGGAWFTDDIWRMLNRCWEAQPENRPSVAAVLECLERVSKDPESLSLQANGDLGMDEGDSNLTGDSSEAFSWSNPRCFAGTLLRRILC